MHVLDCSVPHQFQQPNKMIIYALWRLIALWTSSNVDVDEMIGSKCNRAVPGCMLPFLGQYRPVSVPTGIIGNFNVCDKNKRPFFNAG